MPRRLLVVAFTGLLVGCSAHVRPETVPPARTQLPLKAFSGLHTQSITLRADPVLELIARAEKEFATGESWLRLGHRASAREHFDQAVDLLLSWPGGARTDPTLQIEFDRLLDRISALEAQELRAGDGFAETRSEPAVIDDLLAVSTFERPEKPAATTAELVEQDLAKTPHDLPIEVNDKVLSFIELFQGNLHTFMEEGLARGARYLPMILQVFKEEQIPLDLAYVPLVESAFKPTALSRASAKGMWQFEAGTAKDQGLEQNWFLDERSDPEKATRAAAQYFKMLRDLFDGDWHLALASYNAGMGRVQRALKTSKTTDYWELTSTARYLPRETREYVPMILAAVLIARNPAQYGFDVGPVEPLSFDTVPVPDALALNVVAEWLDVPVELIQGLNPELRRGMTPRGQHDLKVPSGMAPVLVERLSNAPPSAFAADNFHFYTSKNGDTLSSVARKYKTTTAKLASANDLKPTSRLRNGTTLLVPLVPTAALASRPTARPAPPAASASTPSRSTTSAAAKATYRVKAGDTLYSIAQRFDTTVDALKRLNRLSSNALSVGKTLTVRANRP